MRTPFDYKYQNPSGFACLMLIRAIVIFNPLGKQNLLYVTLRYVTLLYVTLRYFTLSIFWADQSKGERRRQAVQPLLKDQPMKYRTLNQGLTTTPGTSCPTLFVWVL